MSFQKHNTKSKDLEKIQSNVDQAFRKVFSDTDKRTIPNVSLSSSGTNSIEHMLGRPLTGYNVVRKRANANVWDSQDSNKSPHLLLLLNCSANVVVDLEVF